MLIRILHLKMLQLWFTVHNTTSVSGHISSDIHGPMNMSFHRCSLKGRCMCRLRVRMLVRSHLKCSSNFVYDTTFTSTLALGYIINLHIPYFYGVIRAVFRKKTKGKGGTNWKSRGSIALATCSSYDMKARGSACFIN